MCQVLPHEFLFEAGDSLREIQDLVLEGTQEWHNAFPRAMKSYMVFGWLIAHTVQQGLAIVCSGVAGVTASLPFAIFSNSIGGGPVGARKIRTYYGLEKNISNYG